MSRSFKLKLTQEDWDEIFANPDNQWPDVNIGNDDDHQDDLDDWIADQDFDDETPDPRITRGEARREQQRLQRRRGEESDGEESDEGDADRVDPEEADGADGVDDIERVTIGHR